MASSSTASDTEYLIPEWFFENSDEMDHVSIPGWFFEPSNDLEFANPDMTPENAVPNLLGSSNPAYVLPGWFMERNVKTPLELTRMPNQIVFCDCKDCEEAKADDEAFEDEEQWATQTSAGVKNVGEPGQHTDTIHYKTFAELCDTTFLTFAPGDEGKLAFPRDSSVVYRVEKPSTCSCCSGTSIVEPVWMDRAVVQLAKKLAFASLISFDFEDLEELGYDFHRQDNQAKKRCTDDEDEGTDSTAKSWDPDMESFTTYLEQFFAIRSERHANTESWQRNQRVMSAVLDAATSKTTTEGAKNESGQQPDSGAILIHIIDCSFVNEALGRRVKRRVLTRFAAMVQAKREEGQAVSMLLSTKSSSYKPGEKEYRKIGGTIGSTVTASNDTIRDLDSREKLRKGIINSRRMRRFMRQEVSHLFSSEFLDDSSDWASADRGKNYKSFGDKLWSTVEMRRVLAQLMGRGWRSGKPRTRLDFADVRAVLRRIGLFTQVDADTDGQTGNEENEATKNLNLNRYEEDLRECVVNRGKSRGRTYA